MEEDTSDKKVGKHVNGLVLSVGQLKQLNMLICRKYKKERKEMYGEAMRLGEQVVTLRVLSGNGDYQGEVKRAVIKFLLVMGLYHLLLFII